MKRIYFIILAVVITAAVLAACQATPKKQAVIQKDQAQMIEKAQASDTKAAGKMLKELLGAPENFVMNNSYGSLTIAANAPVVLPDTGKMPVLDVRSAVFPQDTVNKYWGALAGNRQMWEWSDQPTKADIQQMIVNQKQMKSKAESDGKDTKGYDSIITELGKLYQTAPDTAAVKPATSQLKEKINWDPVMGTIDTRYMGTSGSSAKSQSELQKTDGWIFFSTNNPWTGKDVSIKPDKSPATIHFEASAIEDNFRFQSLIKDDSISDSSVTSLLKITPKEAKQKVEDLLNRTGTPMEVNSISLLSDADQGTGKKAQHYAYEVTCVRTLDSGLTVCALPKGSPSNMIPPGYLPKPAAPSFSVNWEYEMLVIQLDDNGFFQITWQSPIEITGTEVEDSKLLPFKDIKSVFEKMLYASYEPNIQDGYTMTCNVSQLRLEMMRVRKQNSDPDALEGLLVPVWNFYGQLLLHDSGGKLTGGTIENGIILTINAIDGSVIDPEKGY